MADAPEVEKGGDTGIQMDVKGSQDTVDPEVKDGQEVKRILVVGSAGAGKSSLIKLVTGADVATSAGALGCTFEEHMYRVEIGGQLYEFVDTVGFNEATGGTVEGKAAVKSLLGFMRRHQSGFHTMLYVRSKGGRLNEMDEHNTEFFGTLVCDTKVPLVYVITGCEMDEPMTSWWEGVAAEYHARFPGLRYAVSITCPDDKTIASMRGSFQKEVKNLRLESRASVIDVITKFTASRAPRLYEDEHGLVNVLRRSLRALFVRLKIRVDWACLRFDWEDLLRRLGFDEKDIAEVAAGWP